MISAGTLGIGLVGEAVGKGEGVGGGGVGRATWIAVAVMGVLSAVGVKILADALQPGVMKRKREVKTMIFVDVFVIVSESWD
jgi:hypothetical protein